MLIGLYDMSIEIDDWNPKRDRFDTKTGRIESKKSSYDTGYRTADSAAGHDAWLGICFFDERRNVGTSTEVAVGLCLWCDGGGIGMVVAHTRNGDGSRQRQMERYACGSWIPVGHRVPIGA